MTTNSHIKNPTEEVLREAKRQLAIRAAEIVVVQAAETWLNDLNGWIYDRKFPMSDRDMELAAAVSKLKEARSK